jgi:hypothetical protein
MGTAEPGGVQAPTRSAIELGMPVRSVAAHSSPSPCLQRQAEPLVSARADRNRAAESFQPQQRIGEVVADAVCVGQSRHDDEAAEPPGSEDR